MRVLSPLRLRADDSGFTLVEVVVSLLVAAIIFLALAAASLAGVRGAVVSRQNQQSVDVLTKAIEAARGLPIGSISMVTTDLGTNDAGTINTSANPPTMTIPNVGSGGAAATETVVTGSTGSIYPHVTTVTVNGNNYTLKRYVTLPSGASVDANGFPSFVRLTAVVTWSAYGKSHTRRASTIITDTRRGLPLPNFTMKPVGSQTATQSAGTVVSYGFVINNLGARDGFNVKASTGTWNFFVDVNQTGIYDPSTDTTALGNYDSAAGDTQPDTGLMETGSHFYVVAERTIASGESAGTSTVTFTATSIAQPTATTASHTVNDTLTVTATTVGNGGNCPAAPTSPAPSAGSGTTLTAYALNNGTVDGNSTTQIWNPMTRADCTMQAQDYNFSTESNAPGSTGRVLTPGGADSTTSNNATTQVADWRWQPAATTTVAGTATVTVYVQCNTAGTLGLTAYIGLADKRTNSVYALATKGTGSKSVSCAGSWTAVTIQVPFSAPWTLNYSNGNPDLLGLRVVSTTGSPTARIDYDSPTRQSVMYLGVAP